MIYRSILAVFLAMCSVTVTFGQGLIAYDPFNQNTGQLNGSASSGVPWPAVNTWQPAFGNGGLVTASTLNYGPLDVSGNKSLFAWFTGHNASVRSLGSNRGGAPADFWISLLATFNQPDQGLYLYQGTQQQMSIGVVRTGGVLGMNLNAAVTGGITQSFAASPSIPANGSTHFLAAHFQLGSAGATNTITLYVDPAFSSLGNGSLPTGASTASFGTALDFSFNSLLIGNFSGVTGTAGTFTLDEIRLGPTWVSVSAVPEPSTIILLVGASAGSLYLWRRRRLQAGKGQSMILPEDAELEG